MKVYLRILSFLLLAAFVASTATNDGTGVEEPIAETQKWNKVVMANQIKGDYGSVQSVLKNRLIRLSNKKQGKLLTTSIRKMQLLNKVRREITQKINICFDRFKRCSETLSPQFCANYDKNLSFYLWAKKLANEIMEGTDGMKCPDELLQKFLTNQITSLNLPVLTN